jgi:hypothetical protein
MESDLAQRTPGHACFLRTEIGTGTENGEVSEILDFFQNFLFYFHVLFTFYMPHLMHYFELNHESS